MKAMLLLSGGIDSPVAGYQLARHGVALEAVHFVHGAASKVEAVNAHLGSATGMRIPLHIVHYDSVQTAIQTHCEQRFQCVLCKRFMLRIASELGRRHGCDALATGDSIGQVASQTLDNMAVILTASSLPVLQPLLCFDKQETIRIARSIGSYRHSTVDAASCPYTPKQPATRSSLERIQGQEALLPSSLVAEALAEAADA